MTSTRFHILRYFLLSLLLTIPGVTGVAAYFMTETFQNEILEEARGHATQVARNIFHNLEEQFIRPSIAEGRLIDLLNEPEQLATVAKIVDLATFGHRIERVYFFDRNGVVTFSTVAEHIGYPVPPENIYFHRALAGEVASAIRDSGDPLDMTNAPSGSQLLETYVPIYSALAADSQVPVGVVEVYQDMTVVAAAFGRSRQWVLWTSLASMIVLASILMILAVKADRIIGLREGEILSSNRALQELSNDLERQVQERTSQLIHHEKLAGIGTLSAGVAHEINNPLATILTCVDGSLNRLNPREDLDEELQQVRKYLTIIDAEVNRCTRITYNLLDFSRQHSSVANEELDLNHLVRQTVDLLHLGDDAKEIDIELDLQATSDGVYGDSTQIRQVIHNLFSNGLAAVGEVEKPKILMLSRSTESESYVECVDNGPGVSDEIRSKIFEPFFTTKAAGEGTGLGLSLCYGIAQRHGGSCSVIDRDEPLDSELWRGRVGARLRFVLPRHVDGVAAAEPINRDEGD